MELPVAMLQTRAFSHKSANPCARLLTSQEERSRVRIQTHLAQKPLIQVEVNAHVVRKRPGRDGAVWAGAGVAWCVCVLSLMPLFTCAKPVGTFLVSL
jgi:hypothetical protein